MQFKISQMAAYTIADLTDLDPELVKQIYSRPSKADYFCFIAPIEALQKARDELEELIKSDEKYDTEIYNDILQEIDYLATLG